MLNGYDLYRDRIPGLERTIGVNGDIPQQIIQGYTVTTEKRLYKSLREQAILTDKTFRAGYGWLERGTVLAVDFNDTSLLVPYTPDTIAYTDISRVFLLTDLTASTTFYVDLLESYKLAVDDYIVLSDTDGTYETEKIASIDRTTYEDIGQAFVTISACAGTFTVAKKACCWVKAKTEADTNKCSLAKYVLDMDIDTGAGANAKGGLGTVILTNALIYKDACVGLDATALSDLGFTEEGIYYLIK